MDWDEVKAFAVMLGPDADPELVRNTIRLIPGVSTVSAQGEVVNDRARLLGEVERLREIVKEAWRLWADITGGRPIYPQLDGGFAVVRVSPERLAAFDALFRPSAAVDAAPAVAGEDRIPPAGAITQNPEIAAGTIIDVGRHVSDAPAGAGEAVAQGASDAGDGER